MIQALLFVHVLVGQLDRGDAGFRTPESSLLEVRRRVLDLHAPERANEPFIFMDSARLDGRLQARVVGGASIAGELDAGILTFPSAVRSSDLVVTTISTSAVELRVDDTRLALDLTLDQRATTVSTPDALEVWFQSRPVFRLSGLGDLRWNGSTLSIDTLVPPASLRLEVALTRVLVDGPPGESTAFGTWGASMVWHPDRQQLIRVGGSFSAGTWAWEPDAGWRDLAIPSPPGRVRGAMVWDPVRRSMVLFGGSGEVTFLDDTWEFIDGGWTERTTTNHPPARWSHGFAWDPLRQRGVLFGGLYGPSVGGTEFRDTWEWDGTNWTQRLPPPGPSARDAHGMAFDESLGEVVVFGGWGGRSPALNDAWSWNGMRWRRLALSNPPPARASMGFAWDPVGRRLVTTGGWNPVGPATSPMRFLRDTWALDATGWSRLQDAPTDWYRMAIAGHPTLGVVTFGGANGQITLNDTLALSSSWRSLNSVESRGPLVFDGYVWLTFAGGGVWTPWPSGWKRTEQLRFPTPSLAAHRSGLLALVPADGGSTAWFDDGVAWRETAALPRVSAMALERATNSLWLELEGAASVVEWPADAGLLAPRPLPSLDLKLAAGAQTTLLLVGADVKHWNPSTGDLMTAAPHPFPDGGSFTLLSDARRDVLIASNGQRALEWAGVSWDEVDGPAGRGEWTNEHSGDFFGWATNGGLVQYEPLRELGARCGSGLQCRSGFCADGVCCRSACLGGADCLACSIAAGGQVDGECGPIRGEAMQVCGGSESDCAPRRCTGATVCPPSAPCIDGGGVEPSPRDAGSLPLAPGPLPGAPRCGCDATAMPSLGFVALALVWARRRRTQTAPRGLGRSGRERGG